MSPALPATAPIRVLIADDIPELRSLLRVTLQGRGFELVGEASDGRQALERTAELEPDVVLMDIVMPELDGIRATERLRERASSTRVLMLSSFDDDERVLPALRAGAAGYLLKHSEPEELVEAIRTVHRGEPVLCREATERVLAALHSRGERPQGTVTILFTDVVGSTQLLERLGEERARELFREHEAIVRKAVGTCGGTEVEQEGDSFMLVFPSARSAVRCATEIQRRLAETGPPEIALRIGLNTGDVISEGDRYFGKAIFVAARIAATAAGGEILVSELTRALASDDARFSERGAHVLKGLKGEHRLFEVEWD